MNTKEVKTVLMYGPMISDPAKMEERAIPVDDVEAYKAHGWAAGALPKDAKAEDVVVPASAIPVMAPVVDAEVVEAVEPKPKTEVKVVKKGKK